MKKTDWKTVWANSLSGTISLTVAILFYFVVLNLSRFYSAFQQLKSILSPFILGGVMAYLLKTPCNALERFFQKSSKTKKRAAALSIFSVLFLSVLIIYLLMSLVLPELVNSISVLVKILPGKADQYSKWISEKLSDNAVLETYVNNTLTNLNTRLQAWLKQDLLPLLTSMMGDVTRRVGSAVALLKNMIIGIIVCIYLLGDRKRFARQGKAVLYAALKPTLAEKVLDEFRFIDKTFGGFFGGKLLDSAIVGLICYAFCLTLSFITGFPNAMLISVIVGLTNIIPYFGPFIGAVPSLLLIMISSPKNCLFFLIFVVLLQQIDGNIIGPKILADSVGLSGFWVLFSITLFGGLFGFFGILVGVPVFAVIYDLIRRLVIRELKRNDSLDVLDSKEN